MLEMPATTGSSLDCGSAALRKASLRVGFTYDLREEHRHAGCCEEQLAELDGTGTVGALATALESLGYAVDRIGDIRRLAARLSAGERWDIVFNMAVGLHGFGREAAVPALLDAYGVPYTFSDPLTLVTALHKATAKLIVRSHGVPTPDFRVIESAADLEAIELDYPLFAKPVAEGSSKGVHAASHVSSPAALRAVCERLLARYRQPVLVERFLPGREFTVGIVGTGCEARALGVMEICLGSGADPHAYTYQNKSQWEERVSYRLLDGSLAEEASGVALGAWRALGGRDCGRVDLRCDERGRMQFIEANPLPGLDPRTGDIMVLCGLLGRDCRTLLGCIMDSALRRTVSRRCD